MVLHICKLLISAAIVLAPSLAAASLTLSISDGTTTVSSPRNNLREFSVSRPSAGPFPIGTTSVHFLTVDNRCSSGANDAWGLPGTGTQPCPVGFPSGLRPPASTDTFAIRDHDASNRARLSLNLQSTTAQITLTNVKIKSLVAGRTLRITYGTATGDLPTIPTAGTYPATLAVGGNFKNASGLQASACALGVSNPCLQGHLRINLVSLNGVGSNLSNLITATVPCSNTTTVPCSPPGGSGSYNSLGVFTAVSDSGTVSCGTSCSPVHNGTLTAKFSGTNETLTLTGSHTYAASLVSAEDPNSLTGVFTALQGEFGDGDVFVSYTGGGGLYQVIPNPPLTNQTRNVKNSATVPLAFNLARGTAKFAETVALVSIGCDSAGAPEPCVPATEPLAPSAASGNDSGYLTFIPSPFARPIFNALNTLIVHYSPTVSPPASPSGDPRLGDVTFSDCSAGSVRVDIALADPSTNASRGVARVYLGTEASDTFRSNCAGAGTLSGVNLVTDSSARLDTSGISGVSGPLASCCVTFSFARTGPLAKLVVSAVSVVVDQGVGAGAPTRLNHKLTVTDMTVNARSMSDTDEGLVRSLVTVEGPFPTITDLPADGTFMRITKLSQTNDPEACVGLAGDPCPTVVRVVPSAAISTSGGKFTTAVNVNDLLPVAGGTTYAVEMCLFGSPSQSEPASPAAQEQLLDYYKSFEGICPATVGILNLK